MLNSRSKTLEFSIIIPAYNEAKIIGQVVKELKSYLAQKNYPAEIIAVNDGSTDQTEKILRNITGVRVINHPYNKGYGAALKTGAQNAQSDWLLWYDGDGQHQPEFIEKLLEFTDRYDMIIGARTGYQGPLLRRPGKKILHWLANYLTGRKIPDLNSGLRLVRKKAFRNFSHIFPNGFSISTTITLAFFREGLNVKYVPITVSKRTGKSFVKTSDGLRAFMLILRTIILFSPLRIFLPISALIFGLSILSLIFDILIFSKNELNIADTTILLFISSLIFFQF